MWSRLNGSPCAIPNALAANSVVQVAAFIVMMGLERIAEMLDNKRISIQVSVVLNIPFFR
jgi:hypothetical protein